MFKKLSVIIMAVCIQGALAANRLIIKYKPTAIQASALASGQIGAENIRQEQMSQKLTAADITNLSAISGMKITEVNRIGTGAHVVELEQNLSAPELQQIMQKIKADPTVEYVTEDRIVHANTVPQINPLQWDMQGIATTPVNGWIGDYFQGAWSELSGNPGTNVVVAVVDTGYTPHTNFIDGSSQWHLLGYSNISPSSGYQMISNCSAAGLCPASQANTAPPQSYIPNALDQGDYLSQSDYNSSSYWSSNGCAIQNASSWHGTHVTGTLIAQGYNGSSGVLGGAYNANVLPVRVLGKCGGSISDVENGMLWAAGYSVPNPTGGTIAGSTTKAQVISLSLGADGACSSDEQDAINTITGNGSMINAPLVVVAAGNEATNVSNSNPANCQYVVSVAAKGPTNTLAYYSNFGNTTITASGGSGTLGQSAYIYSTIWDSTTNGDTAYESVGAGGQPSYEYLQGTSMATPHASAAIADIIAYLQANNESWTYSSIVQVLQNTANYNYNNCNNVGCATSGALNAESAITYLVSSYDKIIIPSQTSLIFTAGQPSTQTVSFTNNNLNLIAIQSVIIANNSGGYSLGSQNCAPGGIPGNGGTCSVSISFSGSTASAVSASSGSQLQLLGLNGSISATVSLSSGTTPTPSPTPTSTPVPSGGGGGGGCSAISNGEDYSMIILLLFGAVIYIFRRRNAKNIVHYQY